MKFDMKPEDRAFLKLAEAVATGTGDSKKREELEMMMQNNPELRAEFAELQKNVRDENLAEFWSVAVRVMVGTASPQEVEQVESWKSREPERWGKYQEALEFVDALASRHDSLKRLKIGPLPPKVREKLLKELRSKT